MDNYYYKGLEYPAQKLSAYTHVLNTFIISLRNGKLVRFLPDDAASFSNWLKTHRVRTVDSDTRQPVIAYN